MDEEPNVIDLPDSVLEELEIESSKSDNGFDCPDFVFKEMENKYFSNLINNIEFNDFDIPDFILEEMKKENFQEFNDDFEQEPENDDMDFDNDYDSTSNDGEWLDEEFIRKQKLKEESPFDSLEIMVIMVICYDVS